jgi:PAS domain S-box-containing protein
MLSGQIAGRTVFVINNYGSFFEPGEAILVMFGLWFTAYAIPLFRFHVLDPIPLARSAVIEQMGDGMMVLDSQGNIVDVNPAAASIFGLPPKRLRGLFVGKVLPAYPELSVGLAKRDVVKNEISLKTQEELRYFNFELTSLKDRRGEALGQLLLLSETTEQKQAQEQLVSQQRALATLGERERLARELHDGIGQVLGYVSMQAESARKYIQQGNTEKADSVLGRLTEVAKDSHADVRDSILELRTSPAQEWSFIPALKQYADRFRDNYGVQVELVLADNFDETIFDPGEGVQLLRIIQEALTNSRKHGNASHIKISIEQEKGRKTITITDDGRGFDVDRSEKEGSGHFGLGFMKERMNEIGGSLTIDSRAGSGTTVSLSAPVTDVRGAL